jgi:hypothetical protein
MTIVSDDDEDPTGEIMSFQGTRLAPEGRASSPHANPDSIPELVRTATDSFVELVAAHIRLTNLELVADLEARARLLVTQLVISLVAVLGYGLVMIALGLAAGALMDRWAAFLILGGIHLMAAGIAALAVSRRRRRAPQVDQALQSLGKSVTAVADAVLGPSGQARARN